MGSLSTHGGGPRFLFADDHAIFAETLRVYLEKTYTVVEVVGRSRHGGGSHATQAGLDPKALLADARGIITGWKFIDQQQLQRSEALQGGLLLARRQPQRTTTNPESRDCQKYESNKCSGQV